MRDNLSESSYSCEDPRNYSQLQTIHSKRKGVDMEEHTQKILKGRVKNNLQSQGMCLSEG